MKWTNEGGIEMWQFAKGSEPLDLSTEGPEIDPETWGTVSLNHLPVRAHVGFQGIED